MYEWVDVSDRLREVRDAQQNFAMRGVIEQWVIGPMLLDRLADDLNPFICKAPKLQPPAPNVDGRDRSQ